MSEWVYQSEARTQLQLLMLLINCYQCRLSKLEIEEATATMSQLSSDSQSRDTGRC